MNTLQRDLKQFTLRALLRAQDQPINDDTLRSLLRSAFAHVAFTDADLGQLIKELETSGLLTGTNDDLFGVMWALSFDPTNLDLWRKKVTSLQQLSGGGQIPNDGTIGALAILDATLNGGGTHPDGLQVVDESKPPVAVNLAAFPYYTDMPVYAWMGSVKAVNVTGAFSYVKNTGGPLNLTPKTARHLHSMRLKLTNLPTGSYELNQLLNTGESIPAGLAQNIYTELGVLQWKLRHEIVSVAPDAVTLPLMIKPGKHLINLAGGNAA